MVRRGIEIFAGSKAMLLLLLPVFASANVGGIIYKPSVFAMEQDSASVKTASIEIACDSIGCSFKTKYSCSDSGKKIRGYFFGDRISELKENGNPIGPGIELDSNESQSIADKFEKQLFPFENRYAVDKYGFESTIGSDSSFSVSGRLNSELGRYWGLAELIRISDARHVLLSPKKRDDTKKLVYFVAPIQGFDSLHRVELKATIEGGEFSWLKIDRHWQDIPENSRIDTTFTGNIPGVISLAYKPKLFKAKPGFGGPLGYIGSMKGGVSAELGWEFNIPVLQSWAILPSVNYSFTRKEDGFANLGLRTSFYGTVIIGGQYLLANQQIVPIVGFDWGPLGIEARLNGILFKLSL